MPLKRGVYEDQGLEDAEQIVSYCFFGIKYYVA